MMRIISAASILLGSSWVCVKFLEKHMTKFIIDSTLEALEEEEVSEELYDLFTKLVERMLQHPETKERTLSFVKHVLKTEVVGEAVLRLATETQSTESYKNEGLNLMKNIAYFVLKDRSMTEAAHTLSVEIIESIRFIENIRQIGGIHNSIYKVPTYDSYKLFNFDIHEVIQEQIEHFKTVAIQEKISHFPTNKIIKYEHVKFTPYPKLQFNFEKIRENLISFQEKYGEELAQPPAKKHYSVEYIEQNLVYF